MCNHRVNFHRRRKSFLFDSNLIKINWKTTCLSELQGFYEEKRLHWELRQSEIRKWIIFPHANAAKENCCLHTFTTLRNCYCIADEDGERQRRKENLDKHAQKHIDVSFPLENSISCACHFIVFQIAFSVSCFPTKLLKRTSNFMFVCRETFLFHFRTLKCSNLSKWCTLKLLEQS